MPVRFTVLASGSAGNASLVQVGRFGVLIDAGLGPRLLAGRLAEVDASWDDVHAVLLTHTHSDHWNERSLAQLLRRSVPLYCHARHIEELAPVSPAFADLRAVDLVQAYRSGEDVILPVGLSCRPIELSHDSGPTFGFRFEWADGLFGDPLALAYLADLGCWDGQLADALADVDVLALEFNHDADLERSSGRPYFLVERVLGDRGHLSNAQAARLLEDVLRRSRSGRLRHVVQLHLSRDCNRPTLARRAARNVLAAHADITLHTAAQDRPGPSLLLGDFPPTWRSSPRRSYPRRTRAVATCQPVLPGCESWCL